ncbi:MAG TPA: NAD(P)H-quinone dehydrogenase [Dermatophilaceae bacterium]|nr:NAD(P)H-quinone dehydrogenase [Dermatophilaceae bacterium]
MTARSTSVVVVGAGPGGYEAALVARQLGADVTIIDSDGVGGAAVLTDCVPSKTLISTSTMMTALDRARSLGVHVRAADGVTELSVVAQADLGQVNDRVIGLAQAQSDDIADRLVGEGVRLVRGRGRLLSASAVRAELAEGGHEDFFADVILLATGAQPRELASAVPDGERILTWKQLYALEELPTKLVVVGSGVTGAELAHAYLALGCQVALVSSRDQVLPGEDSDAARVIEDVFRRRGMEVLSRSRAASVTRTADGVAVALEDGRVVTGSHALMAVGSVPRTSGLGLAEVGVSVSSGGYVEVDGVSRTTARGVYAAGDCTGVLPLASVAAMQGRIAMWHALGDAVSPLNLGVVCANIFTDPQIATVGCSQADVDSGRVDARTVMLPLATNPRAKMDGFDDGFVKLFASTGVGTVVGGVIVAPRASELIYAVALAVQHHLTVDQLASTFTIYPSLTGSIAEAARRLHS